MTTEIAKTDNKKKVVSFFQKDEVKNRFMEILGQNGAAFASSMLALVNTNDKLQLCSPDSLYIAAMMAATLNLPINPNLGFAYIIPYEMSDDVLVMEGTKEVLRKVKTMVPQFQMGYKGFIQLCQRTGLFKTISACPIYKEQLISENPLTGYVFDFTKKAKPNYKPIGYAAYFSLMNGFEKTEYWTVEEVIEHGQKFSKSYAFGPWKDNFDAMAQKTVLKLLLKTYAPMTVEMNKAIQADQGVIKDVNTMEVEYIDEGGAVITLEMLTELYNEKKADLTDSARKNTEAVIENKQEDKYETMFNLLKQRG